MVTSVALFMLLLLLSGHSGAAPAPSPFTPPPPPPPLPPPGPTPVAPAGGSVAPWPQVVPAGLPPFPGSGWVPDEPPPPEVQARASALLHQLWTGPVGTFKTEQTAGRWITYQSQAMGSKKGVVAWREANAGAPSPIANASVPAFGPPSMNASPPIVSPATGNVVPAVAPSGHPTVHQGASGPIVQQIQQAVGATPVDGKFGPGTAAKVKAFQAAHGLAPDGIVGPQTWNAILSGGVPA
jgi:hypothetical protein